MNDKEILLAYRAAVKIDDIDELHISPTQSFAIVWLDTAERPDLSVLSSKTQSLDGHCILSWFYLNPGERGLEIGFYIKMRQPAQFALSLVFPVAMYQQQLRTIARGGRLWLVEGPPPKNLTGRIAMSSQEFIAKVVDYTGNGLFIELQEHLVVELQTKLAEWKTIL